MTNKFFKANYLFEICSNKTIKICTNQYTNFLTFLFTEDSLKIKKCLELLSRPSFSHNFLIKTFFCNVTWTGQIWSPDYVYFPSYSVKCVLCFMLRHLMTSWHFNIWKVKIWLSQERKELLKWNKKHFFLFKKCALLGVQNKLAKI